MISRTFRWVSVAAMVLGASGALAASNWSAGFSSCTPFASEVSTVACTDTAGVIDAVQVTAVGTSSYNAGSNFALRDLNSWSGGLGVDPINSSEGSPEHAIDNNLYIDAVLIRFDSSVVLNQITLGWRQNDWDFSVFAYTGTNSATETQAVNLDLNSTLGGGWTLVQNYAAPSCSQSDPCGGSKTIGDLNAGEVSSSWWVISAYAAAYGTGNQMGLGVLGESKKDYFKLLSVAGTLESPSGVPEPASFALVGVALAGVIGSRRRKSPALA